MTKNNRKFSHSRSRNIRQRRMKQILNDIIMPAKYCYTQNLRWQHSMSGINTPKHVSL